MIKLKLDRENFETSNERLIGSILAHDLKKLDQSKIETILKEKKPNEKFGETALRLDFVTETDIAKALAIQAHVEYVDLDEIEIDQSVARSVDYMILEREVILPVKEIDENTIMIAVADPFSAEMFQILPDKEKRIVVSEPTKILFKLKKIFQEISFSKTIDELAESILNEIEVSSENLPASAQVNQLLELLILNGAAEAATDIHLTVDDQSFRVFYRIRGQLEHFRSYDQRLYWPLAGVVKNLSGMPSDPLRALDSSFTINYQKKNIHLRVSKVPTVPHLRSESLVLRILDKSRIKLELDSLGFEEQDLERLRRILRSAYGMALVVGPTGSGKTTTLYSMLIEQNPFRKTILTIEDPVEYQIPGLRQVQVNREAGLDFSTALKAFLRQDPDIILVGEIRDSETAETAINAALTGHLVFSTLHTNTAYETIARLFELNVDLSLINQALLFVINQRLVRRLCRNCRAKREPSFDEKKLFLDYDLEEPEFVYDAIEGNENCIRCSGSGYEGLTIVYEILEINQDVREIISSSEISIAEKIKRLQRLLKKKKKLINQNCLRKIKKGITTFSEAEEKVFRSV